jgi:hypothetical protein
VGKAAKFKKLRKLANQLPALNTKRVIGERISGKELMGIEKDIDGKPIDSRLTYYRKKVVEVPLNYNRKLKDAYKKKAGMKGAETYANSVVNFVNSKLKVNEYA